MKFGTKFASIAITHGRIGPEGQLSNGVKTKNGGRKILNRLVRANKSNGAFLVHFTTLERLNGRFEIRDHNDKKISTNQEIRRKLEVQMSMLIIPFGHVLIYNVQRNSLLIGNTCHPDEGSHLKFYQESNTANTDRLILNDLRAAHEIGQQLQVAA